MIKAHKIACFYAISQALQKLEARGVEPHDNMIFLLI